MLQENHDWQHEPTPQPDDSLERSRAERERLMQPDPEQARRIAYLEAKISWLETLLEQWIVTETTSMMNIDKWTAQAAVLKELRRSPESQARNAQAIRAAWQAGDRKRAIALYSSVYDVDEKTAKATLESTPGL